MTPAPGPWLASMSIEPTRARQRLEAAQKALARAEEDFARAAHDLALALGYGCGELKALDGLVARLETLRDTVAQRLKEAKP